MQQLTVGQFAVLGLVLCTPLAAGLAWLGEWRGVALVGAVLVVYVTPWIITQWQLVAWRRAQSKPAAKREVTP